MNEKSNPNENPAPVARAKTRWGAIVGIVILAFILAIVLTPQIGSDHHLAKTTAAKADIATFSTALAAFQADTGYFPKGSNGLIYLIQKPSGVTNWRGPYLLYTTANLLDPWGHDYIYACPGRHNPQSFDLSSMGPDGQVGTEDNIYNWQQR